MDANETPFRPAWWSFSLPGYQPCRSTYCQFSYESLPPLDHTVFQGDFRWLPPLDGALEDMGAADDERAQIDSHLPSIIAEAEARGVILPAAFLTFMRDPAAHRRIPSCTACYFDLPAYLTPSPFGDGGYLIRFLNDQQWVLLWHLYLRPNGDHCVVVSPTPYDDLHDHTTEDQYSLTLEEEPVSREELREETWWCAPSFEVFLYRLWRENHLWFALTEERTLTDDERAYLQYYRE